MARFKPGDLVYVSGTVQVDTGTGKVIAWEPDRKLYRVKIIKNGTRCLLPENCLEAIE
jgi:hypothetical protein